MRTKPESIEWECPACKHKNVESFPLAVFPTCRGCEQSFHETSVYPDEAFKNSMVVLMGVA